METFGDLLLRQRRWHSQLVTYMAMRSVVASDYEIESGSHQ